MISPTSTRHCQFSRPAAMHTINGNRHTELTTITHPVNNVKATTAAMICTHSSVLSYTSAAPVNTIAPTPNAASHCHAVGVTLNIAGNISTCDHSAVSKSHRHRLLSDDMLFCVPIVHDMPANSTTKTIIPMYATLTIP